MAGPVISTQLLKLDGEASPKHASSPTTSVLSLVELKACRLTATSDSDSPLHSPEFCSTYHVYHKKQCHAVLSPSPDPSKERFWGPTCKESREKRKQKKIPRAAHEKEGLVQQGDGDDNSPTCDASDDGAFFLHTPYLAFKDPPRVLYMGSTKHARPAALVHGSLFWRQWKLQLGSSIAEPGVLDPRGVVCWRHNGGDEKALKSDDKMLQGYKVRTWCRLWGETGKDYVLDVNARRKAGIGPDPDDISTSTIDRCARADEVVYLKWTSPFSRDTRKYHFQFAGIDFYWKGTGTVKENRRFGSWCRFNHLKLVAQVPMIDVCEKSGDSGRQEICLGKYTSSVAVRKAGTLELFDAAVWRLMSEYMPSALTQTQVREEKSIAENADEDQSTMSDVGRVKGTTLYQVFISTAMCMVLGEQQKRETIRKIIEALVCEGAGGASG